MHNTGVSVHKINEIRFLDASDWDGVQGKYQSQDVIFLDKNGEVALVVTAFSIGEKFIHNESKRKTVTIGDKTYYEDELAEALSNIKEVK